MPKRPKPKQPPCAQHPSPDWWGRGMALVALLIAIFSLGVDWQNKRLEKARRLDVRLFYGAPISKGIQHQIGLQIKAVNPGYQPVIITTTGVVFPGGRLFRIDRPRGDRKYPSVLSPGANTTCLLAGKDLVNLCESLLDYGFAGTVVLVGFYEDALGTLHKSKPFDFNIEDALKLARAQVEAQVQ